MKHDSSRRDNVKARVQSSAVAEWTSRSEAFPLFPHLPAEWTTLPPALVYDHVHRTPSRQVRTKNFIEASMLSRFHVAREPYADSP